MKSVDLREVKVTLMHASACKCMSNMCCVVVENEELSDSKHRINGVNSIRKALRLKASKTNERQ